MERDGNKKRNNGKLGRRGKRRSRREIEKLGGRRDLGRAGGKYYGKRMLKSKWTEE